MIARWVVRHRAPVVLTVFLFVAQLNALQWQVVWFLADTFGLLDLIGADRTIELLGWTFVVLAALRSRPAAVEVSGASRAAVLWALPASGIALLLAGGALVAVHGAVRLAADGPMLPPFRPLLLLVVLACATRLGSRTVMAATALALLPGVVGTLLVASVGWETAFRSGTRGRLLGPDLLGGARLQGLYPHPNNAGAFAVLLIVVTLTLLARTRGASMRAGLVAIVGVSLLVLAASDSVTAAVALVAALTGRAIVPVLRRLPGSVAATLAVLGGVTLTATPFVLARALGPGALTGRVQVWQEVLATLTARELRWGVGPEPLLRDGGFLDRIALVWDAGDAHNTVMELLLVAGVPGVVAFGLLATTMLGVALRTLEVSRGWSVPVAVVPLVLSVGEVVFVHGPADGRDVLLVSIGLLLAWSRESASVQVIPPRLLASRSRSDGPGEERRR